MLTTNNENETENGRSECGAAAPFADFFFQFFQKKMSLSLSDIAGCSYGNEDRRNRVMFEFHSFSLLLTFSLTFILFGSGKLKRVYAPLSNVVNASLILQIFSNLLYFLYYPYEQEDGNCTEIFFRRVYIVLIMFGELHQVYFIANVLGLSHYRFQIGKFCSLSLESALRWATIIAAVSVLYSMIARRIFMLERNTWGLFIVSLQIHFIRHARRRNNNINSNQDLDLDEEERNAAVIDADHDAVNIFESLTWLQIIPCGFAFIYRVIEMYEFHYDGPLDTVMLALDCVCNYLFYIKIIVLQEKGNSVTIHVVNEEKRNY
jgi:hypothetical protein